MISDFWTERHSPFSLSLSLSLSLYIYLSLFLSLYISLYLSLWISPLDTLATWLSTCNHPRLWSLSPCCSCHWGLAVFFPPSLPLSFSRPWSPSVSLSFSLSLSFFVLSHPSSFITVCLCVCVCVCVSACVSVLVYMTGVCMYLAASVSGCFSVRAGVCMYVFGCEWEWVC